MASNSPGKLLTKKVCWIGLNPAVDTSSAEEEDKLFGSFYKFLRTDNLEYLLMAQMNAKLELRLTKLKFSYIKGEQCVRACCQSFNEGDIEKLKKLLEDGRLTEFLTNYLDSYGLNFQLGFSVREKVAVLALKLENEKYSQEERIQSSHIPSTYTTGEVKVEFEKRDPVLVRVFVPIEIQNISHVCVVLDNDRFETANIPGTFIWTKEIYGGTYCDNFVIEVSHTKSSGFWRFKSQYEENMTISIEKNLMKNKVLHLIFPIDKVNDDMYESAFIAFYVNILFNEMDKSPHSAFTQLEAMTDIMDSYININVKFNKTRLSRIKDTVKNIMNWGQKTVNSKNFPALCFILLHVVPDVGYISRFHVLDEYSAQSLVSFFNLLTTEDILPQFLNAVCNVLEHIYMCAFGKKACLIGFMDRTLKFYRDDFFNKLIQKVVSNSEYDMQLYDKHSGVDLTGFLLRLLEDSRLLLLDKILRHVIDNCLLEEYVSTMKVLLKKSENCGDIHEKLVNSCSQRCSHFLVQTSKNKDLKDLLEAWQSIQSLPPVVKECLQPTLEKHVMALLKNETKLESLKTNEEFVQLILQEPIFGNTEGKEELLKSLSKSKCKIRNCVIDLLREEKFRFLPQDSYNVVVSNWISGKLLSDKRSSPGERILKAYTSLNLCLQLREVQEDQSLQSNIEKLVFDMVEQIGMKEIMKSVGEIEKHEQLHKLFQKHVCTILQGKHSKKSPADIIQDICGVPYLRVRSWLTTNIFKNIIELLDIKKEDSLDMIFTKALVHSEFWVGVFRVSGNDDMIDSLLNSLPCRLVEKSIFYIQLQLEKKHVNYSLVQRLKVKEDDMLKLLTCRLDKETYGLKQKIQNAWKDCFETFRDFHNNTSLIREIYQTLKIILPTDNNPEILQKTLQIIKDTKTKLEENVMLVSDIVNDKLLHSNITEIADYCKHLVNPLKSRVFQNILQRELKKMKICNDLECENSENDDPLDGATLCFLFGDEVETEDIGSLTMLTSFNFIQTISTTCLDIYRNTWVPYFRHECILLIDFKKTFATIRTSDLMEQEIKLAENICTMKVDPKVKSTFFKFANLSSYIDTVNAVTNCLEIFPFHENVDTYMSIVHNFHKLFHVNNGEEEDLEDMTTNDMESIFERVEGIRKSITPEVCELLQVLKSSKSLLEFLEEVIDEDIRNLIDAVEEHSEQYVRESTVSDLIEVKRIFYPILKKTYGNEFTEFFSLLNKQLTTDSKNIPGKVYDCMENLHTLRALYKNVANRGERTKEIIENIVNRGKFSFRMVSRVCDVLVRYKQDKKTISHTSSDLSDLRSRALLLMNAEDKEKTKLKTRKKEDLEQFLFLVDTAFNISNICLQLKESGHFDYSRFELTCEHKELTEINAQLDEEHKQWSGNIALCREKFYYMNFIYPAQLQQLYEFLYKDGNNGEEVLKCLQFINREFTDVNLLKQRVQLTYLNMNKTDVLHRIGLAIQELFQDYVPVETLFSKTKRNAKITDIVQDGIPYIVALEEESPLVLRSLFALYMNTTNTIPFASQILICRKETSVDDIDLFLKRCLGDRSRHLYTITNVENLSSFAQNKFVEALHQLPDQKFLLAIICRGNSHHPFLDQFSDRLSHPTPISEMLLKDCMQKHWPDVLVVSSDLPGLGKTELIQRTARERQMSIASIHISGSIDTQTIIDNLNLLIIREYQVLHLDIGMTDSASALDSLLFQLIILGQLSTGSSTYILTTNHIMIEISNTVGQTLCNSLPTTTSFKRANVDWSNYSDMKISNEINSPVQVVCHYLKALDAGILDRSDLYFTGPSAQKPLKLVECIPLLQKYFSSASDMSYSLLQLFLKVLSDQLKKLSSSVFFRTANIAAMIGDKTIPTVKTNLVKALINASQEFACRSVKSCRALQAALHENISFIQPKMYTKDKILFTFCFILYIFQKIIKGTKYQLFSIFCIDKRQLKWPTFGSTKGD